MCGAGDPSGIGAGMCFCVKRSACKRAQQACRRDGLAHWPEAGVRLLLHRSPLPQLAEFNPLDADSIAGVLKRGSRVVLVVGDQVRWGYGIVRSEPLLSLLPCGCCITFEPQRNQPSWLPDSHSSHRCAVPRPLSPCRPAAAAPTCASTMRCWRRCWRTRAASRSWW